MSHRQHGQTDLNEDPFIVALERGLLSDHEGLRGYRIPIVELIREVRLARQKADRADSLERRLVLAEQRLTNIMNAKAG